MNNDDVKSLENDKIWSMKQKRCHAYKRSIHINLELDLSSSTIGSFKYLNNGKLETTHGVAQCCILCMCVGGVLISDMPDNPCQNLHINRSVGYFRSGSWAQRPQIFGLF